MAAMSTPMVAIELLAACVWVGSFVCLVLVTDAARKVLDGPSQVAFFRAVGRRYGIVGTLSLLAAIGVGLVLAWPPSASSGTMDAAVALAGALVLATAAGMVQARAMTRLRRRAMTAPEDHRAAAAVGRGRRLASGLRGLIGGLTLAIVVLGAQVIAR